LSGRLSKIVEGKGDDRQDDHPSAHPDDYPADFGHSVTTFAGDTPHRSFRPENNGSAGHE
jgi:hypothetical protein